MRRRLRELVFILILAPPIFFVVVRLDLRRGTDHHPQSTETAFLGAVALTAVAVVWWMMWHAVRRFWPGTRKRGPLRDR
jgi:hypothetical protein